VEEEEAGEEAVALERVKQLLPLHTQPTG